MDRKNINHGFKKLMVWPPARRTYAPEGKTPLPFVLLKKRFFKYRFVVSTDNVPATHDPLQFIGRLRRNNRQDRKIF
jgi:hypothetical protein